MFNHRNGFTHTYLSPMFDMKGDTRSRSRVSLESTVRQFNRANKTMHTFQQCSKV